MHPEDIEIDLVQDPTERETLNSLWPTRDLDANTVEMLGRTLGAISQLAQNREDAPKDQEPHYTSKESLYPSEASRNVEPSPSPSVGRTDEGTGLVGSSFPPAY